ncbi:MAG: hypothetical protein HY271_03680 [Deltaproteobacteria bacterium]|nr:hypothetical protein [Deltaproteobacteria bacterium]
MRLEPARPPTVAHRLIRAFVLRTGDSVYGRFAYRRVYRVVLELVRIVLSRDPNIVALVLRTASSTEHWEPGLSDLDLSVIMREQTPSERLPFVLRFWVRVARLRVLAPMVREVDLLTLGEFADATTLAPGPMQSAKEYRVLSCRRRQRERVREVVTAANRVNAASQPQRDLLLRYSTFTLPAYLNLNRDPPAVSQRMLRHGLAKLHALCAPDAPRRVDHDALTIGQAYRWMTDCCRPVSAGGGETLTVQASSGVSELAEALLRLVEEQLARTIGRSPHEIAMVVWRPWHSDRLSLAFLLDDDLPAARYEVLLQAVRACHWELSREWRARLVNDPLQFGLRRGCAVVMSRTMWRCWLTLFPMEAAALAAGGGVARSSESGAAALPDRAPLADYAAMQYGVWLINRNDWVKEETVRRRTLFRDMIRRARTLEVALRTGLLDAEAAGACPSDGASLQELYKWSSEELARLRRVLAPASDTRRDDGAAPR